MSAQLNNNNITWFQLIVFWCCDTAMQHFWEQQLVLKILSYLSW